MLESNALSKERSRLFVQTQGLLGLTLFGVLYWPLLGALGFILPPRLWILVATGLILLCAPVVFLAIRRVYKKRLPESPLAPALLVSVIPVVLSSMLLLPTYHLAPALLPLVYVVSMSLLWPGVAWLFDKRLYLMHALVRTVLALVVWATAPEHALTWLPIAVGGLYLLSSISIMNKLKSIKEMA